MSDRLTPLSSTFRRLAWSNLAAQSAEQIGLAAAPMIAVLALGAGPGETGFLAALQSLPFLLLSLPAGLLADRLSRRRLMVVAEAVRVAALLTVPALAALGLLSVSLLAILGFAAAAGTVAFSVAAPALVPALVPRTALGVANSRLELARSGAFAAGPAIAGALVGWAGAGPAFTLAALLSAAAVVLLIGLREPKRPAPAQRDIVAELRDGALFAWRHKLVRPILLTAVAWNIAWFVLQAAYVPYAVRSLGLAASGIGGSLATFGAGMVVGATLAPAVMRRLGIGAAIIVGPVVSVAAAAAMTATLIVPTGALAALSFFLFGAGPIVWTVSQTTLRQTVTPGTLLGRVSALFMMASAGARPIGAALGGIVGAGLGLESCILLAAFGFLVQALIILLSPIRSLRHLPEAAE
jgi:predicted MFS family arabinose efflux permease